MLKVLEVALSYVGYHEKASNKDLDSFTGNSGSGNWNKFSKYLDDFGDYYAGKKNGYPWCEAYVDACFAMAYTRKIGQKMLYQPNKSYGAGCVQSVGYYKANNAFDKTPHVGDQIYFSYGSGEADHTGLVWQVTDTTVYTVEGNSNNAVEKHSYLRTNKNIYGYGHPNYSLVKETPTEDIKEPAQTTAPTTTTTNGDVKVTLKVLSKGSTGGEVKTLQALLIKKFFISLPVYGVDGDFGAETRAGVRTFQSRYNLTADGVVGQKTWAKLLG